jgi:hypothetical protein
VGCSCARPRTSRGLHQSPRRARCSRERRGHAERERARFAVGARAPAAVTVRAPKRGDDPRASRRPRCAIIGGAAAAGGTFGRHHHPSTGYGAPHRAAPSPSRVFTTGGGVAAIFATGHRDCAKVPSTVGVDALTWCWNSCAPACELPLAALLQGRAGARM